jgi:hypothetical protein
MLIILLVVILYVPSQANNAFITVVLVSTSSSVQSAVAVVGGTLALVALVGKLLLNNRANDAFCCFEFCCRHRVVAAVDPSAPHNHHLSTQDDVTATAFLRSGDENIPSGGTGSDERACVPEVGVAPAGCACCRPTRPPGKDIAGGDQGPLDLYCLGHEQRWGSVECWKDLLWTRQSNMVGRWMRLVWILIIVLSACSLALYCIPTAGVYVAVVLVLPFVPVQKLLEAMIGEFLFEYPEHRVTDIVFWQNICTVLATGPLLAVNWLAVETYADDEARQASILFVVTIAIFITAGVYYQFIDPMTPDFWNIHRIVNTAYRSKYAPSDHVDEDAVDADEAVEILPMDLSLESPRDAKDVVQASKERDVIVAKQLIRGAFAIKSEVKPSRPPANSIRGLGNA